jgi:hypothetical protein
MARARALTSPARKTQIKHARGGKCEACGRKAAASRSLCGPCLKKHNARTAELKRRLLGQGRCAWCGAANRSGCRVCDDCRARYNARRRAL